MGVSAQLRNISQAVPTSTTQAPPTTADAAGAGVPIANPAAPNTEPMTVPIENTA